MSDDFRVVYENPSYVACSDRALVLTSIGIPYDIVHDAGTCVLIVPAEHSARAAEQLRLYDQENPPPVRKTIPELKAQDALPGIAVYFVTLCLVAGMAGYGYFGADWYGAGRVDGTLIRNGEWWRTITALTLHGDAAHLAGNLVFGVLFGLFAGRLLGSGVAWLVIIVCAALGNAVNTFMLDPSHRSIGASTAVFAALGLVAGFVFRGKLMSQERWPYRWGPIVGGFALLMFTGTGDENTDIGAHLTGFLCGFGGGVLLSPFMHKLAAAKLQIAAAAVALALVAGAWFLALGV